MSISKFCPLNLAKLDENKNIGGLMSALSASEELVNDDPEATGGCDDVDGEIASEIDAATTIDNNNDEGNAPEQPKDRFGLLIID